MEIMTTAGPHSIPDQTANLLKGARLRLVETGTRNKLVHVNRSAKRSNALAVINERSSDVFRILKTDGRRMTFKATASQSDDAQDEISLISSSSEDEADESRFTDRFLETPLTQDRLQKTLLKLARDARIAEEEQGVNILYLAMGFLRWFEAENSSVQRESPLFLMPVELVRNERTYVHDVRVRDDDISTNLPLQERLNADFGIKLPELGEGEDTEPSAYCRRIQDILSGFPRWSIDENGMLLGFFSFSKLLMHHDLDPKNWPEGSLAPTGLVQRLLEDGFDHVPPMFDGDSKLDTLLDPAKVMHVVDTDASQAKVIEEVLSGRNLVVQGPPGTGKSQTITNILAAAAHDKKTVLFIAEKMAALQVVYKRMDEHGLSDLCLELHSKSANKKAFLQELAKTLSRSADSTELSADPDSLRDVRDRLNQIADMLHTAVPGCDHTPFEAISSIIGFIGRTADPPKFRQERLAELTREEISRISARIERFAESLATVGRAAEHPFFDVQNLDLGPIDQERLASEIADALDALERLRGLAGKLLSAIGLAQTESFDSIDSLTVLLEHASGAPDLPEDILHQVIEHRDDRRFREAITSGAVWLEAKSELSEVFLEAAWDIQAAPFRNDLAKGAASIIARLFGRYRHASSELATIIKHTIPKAPKERLALANRLLEGQSKLKTFKDEEHYLKPRLGDVWRGEKSDFQQLRGIVNWLARVLELAPCLTEQGVRDLLALVSSDPNAGAELARTSRAVRQAAEKTEQRLAISLIDGGAACGGQPLDRIENRLRKMRSDIHRYPEWVHYQKCRNLLLEDKMGDLVDLLEKRLVNSDRAVEEFQYATAEARWNRAQIQIPLLRELAGIDRHQLAETFQKLDRERSGDVRRQILSGHLGQLPKGASGQMGFLRGEISKKTRHRSIRTIMANAGNMIQRIKPVFMMSPISVAQFLPPGTVKFDLLVIDEASQVRPEEALGAIARASQIAIVGDQKQLPPTTFFDRLAENTDLDDESERGDDRVQTARVEDMESILTLCEARGLRSNMLTYHYRSRDPSLITVSNKEFYEDRLVLPPSPRQLEGVFGLKFHLVPGVYSSPSRGGGRPRTNHVEAVAVIDALAEHAKTSARQSGQVPILLDNSEGCVSFDE